MRRQSEFSDCRRAFVLVSALRFGKGLFEVGDKVVRMLRSYREPHGRGGYVLCGEFGGRHLRVSGGVGVYDKALHVGDIGEQREYFERVDEAPCCLPVSGDFEGEYAAAEFTDIVRGIPEVTKCYNISGEYDYLLKIHAPDMKYYQTFILNVLGRIESLGSLTSTFVMDEVKHDYGVPL